MTTALTFQSTTFDVIDRNGQPWIQSRQLASALGYKDEGSVRKIYKRNVDEFTDAMTATVKLTLGITPVDVRVFSLRGCHLIAMFARTPVAKQFRRWVLDVLDRLAEEERAKSAPAPSRISKRTDPERKALTAIINTWVGMAPIHYASARAQVNAHFGVTSVDGLTVAQVKEAIQWVQSKIDALPLAPAQPALPAVPEKDKFEAYIEKVEQFRAEVRKEMYRLEKEGVDMVNAYKFGTGNLGCFIDLISLWLRDVVISPTWWPPANLKVK